MPTSKPRVQVTLEPATHEVIDRFARLQGRTRGAVIAELFDSIAPSLTRTVALLEAAFEAPEQVKDGLRSMVESLHSEVVAVSGDASSQLDMLLGQVEALPDREPTPVPVTRGSGTDSTPTPKKRKNPGKGSSTGVPRV